MYFKNSYKYSKKRRVRKFKVSISDIVLFKGSAAFYKFLIASYSKYNYCRAKFYIRSFREALLI